VTVADVFDALIHDRPYKHAWPIERAVAEITAQRRHQFDPEVVDAFLGLVERGTITAAATAAHPKPTAQSARPSRKTVFREPQSRCPSASPSSARSVRVRGSSEGVLPTDRHCGLEGWEPVGVVEICRR
jgi:hypothetical protein